jgi:hypothetical protein
VRGHTQAPPPTAPAPGPAGDPTCPLEVPGTSIAVEDTPDGGALVFVTTGDVAAVRTRVTALSDAHDHRGTAHGDLAAMFATSATTTVGEVPNGARVTFKPTKPDDLAALQGELHMHAGHLSGGSCRMQM